MNQRDLELLSSYLDGQLKSSDSARLESRLSTDPDLRGVLDDLRAARGLLRRLPQRRAPRNFRLTPKMVGKNPPLPRTYPAFKFVTAIATFLLFFTVGVNFLAPQLASQPPAYGMGGGGAPEILSAQEAPATEAPAPAAEMVPLPTTTPAAALDSARTGEAPSLKTVVTAQDGLAPASQPVPPAWQILLVGVALLSALVMVMMRQAAANRWRRK